MAETNTNSAGTLIQRALHDRIHSVAMGSSINTFISLETPVSGTVGDQKDLAVGHAATNGADQEAEGVDEGGEGITPNVFGLDWQTVHRIVDQC